MKIKNLYLNSNNCLKDKLRNILYTLFFISIIQNII